MQGAKAINRKHRNARRKGHFRDRSSFNCRTDFPSFHHCVVPTRDIGKSYNTEAKPLKIFGLTSLQLCCFGSQMAFQISFPWPRAGARGSEVWTLPRYVDRDEDFVPVLGTD